MWGQLAVAAAPYALSLLQDRPKAPSAPTVLPPTNRDQYVNQLLTSAYNPNADAWMRASEVAADQVNRQLARQGLGGSSVGGQLQLSTQAELAQRWLQDQIQRQSQALGQAVNYDTGQVRGYNDAANAQYQYGLDAYNQATQGNAAQIQNLAGLAGAGLQAYNQNQIMNRLNQPPVYQGTPTNPQFLNYSPPPPQYGLGGNYQLPVNQDFLSGGQ